jgi:hypothetical protein
MHQGCFWMSNAQVHWTVRPIWEDKVLVCLAILFSYHFQVLVEIPLPISPLRSKNALPQGRGGVIFRRPPHHFWESLHSKVLLIWTKSLWTNILWRIHSMLLWLFRLPQGGGYHCGQVQNAGGFRIGDPHGVDQVPRGRDKIHGRPASFWTRSSR